MSPASEPTAFLGVVSTAFVEYMHIESSQLHRSVGVEVLENMLGTFVPIPTDEAEPFAFLVLSTLKRQVHLGRTSGKRLPGGFSAWLAGAIDIQTPMC